MHRIDVPSATPDHLFTEGSPTGGVPATVVSGDWLNDVQENIVAVVLAAGLPLTKGRADDLLDAIRLLISSVGSPVGGTSASDYLRIPFKDKTSGVARELVIQWGSTATVAGGSLVSVTFPRAFTNAVLFGPKYSDKSASSSATQLWQPSGVTLTGFQAAAVGRINYSAGVSSLVAPTDSGLNWLAIGI